MGAPNYILETSITSVFIGVVKGLEAISSLPPKQCNLSENLITKIQNLEHDISIILEEKNVEAKFKFPPPITPLSKICKQPSIEKLQIPAPSLHQFLLKAKTPLSICAYICLCELPLDNGQ